MIAYYSFYVYFLLLCCGLFIGMVAVRRRNMERALTMLIVVLLAFIGLSANLDQWWWMFVAVFQIKVGSWG